MNFYKESSFKVIVLFAIALVFFGAMALEVANNPVKRLFGPRHSNYHFYLDSGKGVIVNSRVNVMGVNAGHIKSVTLEQDRVRVDIRLNADIPLTNKSYVAIEPKGILGQQFVQIYVVMSPDAVALKDGDEIKKVYSKKSFSELVASLSGVMEDVKEITTIVKNALDHADENTSMGRILKNIEKLTGDMSEVMRKKKQDILSIISDLKVVTVSLKDSLGSEKFRENFDQLTDGLGPAGEALLKLNDIVTQVHQGKGSVGRLLHEDETVENLNTTLKQASKLFGGASRLKTNLNYHFESLGKNDNPGFKHHVSVDIKPGWDRQYHIGLVSHSRGEVKERVLRSNESSDGTTPDSPTANPSKIVRESIQYKGKIRFNATFGRRYYNMVLRGGVFENSGGLGVDLYSFDDSLRFTLESSHFNENYSKFYVRYRFLKGLQILGGIDDIVAKESYLDRQRSSFIGLGLSLDDHDLKSLVGRFLL